MRVTQRPVRGGARRASAPWPWGLTAELGRVVARPAERSEGTAGVKDQHRVMFDEQVVENARLPKHARPRVRKRLWGDDLELAEINAEVACVVASVTCRAPAEAILAGDSGYGRLHRELVRTPSECSSRQRNHGARCVRHAMNRTVPLK
jgi:hypothetical protein